MTGPAQLPSTRTYPFTLGARILDVTIGYVGWPELLVVIAERGRAQVLEARFREDGSLHQLTFTASRGEITSADLRRPGILTALRAWEAHGRTRGRCILLGEPEPEPAIGAAGPGGALRILAHGSPQKPKARKRGADLEQLLRDVADAYRAAVATGDPAPRHTIAARFGYSVASIGRLLGQARQPRNGQPPLLGPAIRGKAGETTQEARAA